MTLLIHITIALLSIATTIITFLSPSAFKIKGSYSLVALTLISGTFLVVSTGAHMLQACVTGLAFVSVSLVSIVASQMKLADRTVKIDEQNI